MPGQQEKAYFFWEKGGRSFQTAMRMAGTRRGVGLLWGTTINLARASELYEQAGDYAHAGITAVFAMQAFDWHFEQIEAWLDEAALHQRLGRVEILPEGRVQWQETPSI